MGKDGIALEDDAAIIGRLGPHWLAGYGIGARLEFLMIPVIFGVGGALIAMVGVNVGAGRRRRDLAVARGGVPWTADPSTSRTTRRS